MKKVSSVDEYKHEAKRAETKQKRVDKIIPMILNSQGLNDKYRCKYTF